MRKNIVREYAFQAKRIWLDLVILFVLSVLIGVFGILNASALKLFVDIASEETSITILQGIVFALLVITGQTAFKSLQSVYSVKTQNKIALSAKSKLLKHMERVSFAEMSKYHSGDLLTRLSDDTDICAGVLPRIMTSIFVGASSCIISLIYGFSLSWKLTILCVCLAPLAVLWSKLLLPFLQKYVTATRAKESEIRSFAQEEISYIPVIKSFSSYQQSERRFDDQFRGLSKARVRTEIASAVLNGGANIVGFFSFIGAAGFGAYLSLQGEITVGTIVGFLQLLNYIVWPFTELMPLIGELQNGKAARKRIREIEELPCEEEEKDIEINRENMVLKVQDVSFSYGEDTILQDLNLELQGKQFVGIMGPSGCGKSTFMQLLIDLYKPDCGKIYLTDGVRSVEGTSIRKYISYVPQDHMLISGTVAENIAYGKEQFEMEKVISAAKRAGIHEYICTLPQQYETQVREKGANFSFGQAQRIAIARAIYKDAPILILDEPTASLDAASKERILETLKNESGSRLCLMVCHDQTENTEIFDRIISF